MKRALGQERQAIGAKRVLQLGCALSFVCALQSGCATTAVGPMATLPAELPKYVSVPHPEGTNYGDLLAIFTDPSAPSPASQADCDKTLRELREKTLSKEEFEKGVRELIRLDPVAQHWCFYSKLYEMEEGLRKDTYLDEKQDRVLKAYRFLTPVARGFMQEYHDSRYLRWAIVRYRKLSEYIFYRKVELSADTANELMGSTSTVGVQRRDDQSGTVLEKYGLMPAKPAAIEHGPAMEVAPANSGGRAPASAEATPAAGDGVEPLDADLDSAAIAEDSKAWVTGAAPAATPENSAAFSAQVQELKNAATELDQAPQTVKAPETTPTAAINPAAAEAARPAEAHAGAGANQATTSPVPAQGTVQTPTQSGPAARVPAAVSAPAKAAPASAAP